MTSDSDVLLASLDAEVAVRAVMVDYMAACDAHDADAVAVLFHDDATWSSTRDSAVLRGREEIRDTYRVACARLTFCVHYLTNEHIKINGDSAFAKWSYFEPATNRGNLAVWTAGRYDHEFVRQGERWYFLHFQIEPILAAPYELGWGSVRQVDLP
jgi:uncharacterized protein (TIGR02246 family)